MSVLRRAALPAAFGALFLFACDEETPLLPTADTGSEDTSGADAGGDVGADVAESDTSGPLPEGCDRAGFDTANVTFVTDGSNARFTGANGTTEPYDLIQIQSLADWNGPTEPGTYSLDGINYVDCGLCLLIQVGCTSSGCEKVFYADMGDVTIDAIGFGEGERFAGTLNDVVFQEVTIDGSTFVSTPVEGGEAWCFDGFSFEGFGQAPAPAGECDPATYDCIGEELGGFELQSCDTGEMVDVGNLVSESNGTWMILTAGWCSACHQWLPQVFGTLESELAEEDLDVVIVLGENTSGGQPTLEYCQQYAAQYERDLSDFYIDHDGTYSYATVFDNVWIYPGDGGSFGLPWNGMFRPDGEYVYADGATPGVDVNGGLNALLAE